VTTTSICGSCGAAQYPCEAALSLLFQPFEQLGAHFGLKAFSNGPDGPGRADLSSIIIPYLFLRFWARVFFYMKGLGEKMGKFESFRKSDLPSGQQVRKMKTRLLTGSSGWHFFPEHAYGLLM